MAVSASGQWASAVVPARKNAASAIVAEVGQDFAAVADLWRAMAERGHATPYQSYSFCEGYFRHVEAPAGARAALIVLRSKSSGEPLALLPLSVRRAGPFAIARFIGGKQSNFNMGVFAREAERLAPADVRAALLAAGRSAGIDVFCLHSQPMEWQGFANPLVDSRDLASPSNGYKLQLEAEGEALLKRRQSKDTRKKLRQKEQKLGAMGALAYAKPVETAEISATFDAFLRLKAERFAAQGIVDPFSAPDVQAFLAEALIGRNGERPLLELHSLTLNGAPVAIFGGAAAGDRFSGLFTAFDATPDIARFSPGDILLSAMLKDCCARGLKTFDLGVGEAHYKDKICDETEVLVESFLPVSLAGRGLALAAAGQQKLKRAIKSSDLGKRAIAALRGMRAKR